MMPNKKNFLLEVILESALISNNFNTSNIGVSTVLYVNTSKNIVEVKILR